MKLSLIQWENEPNEFLGLSPSFKRLVMDKITNGILSGVWFEKVKAECLEIMVCTYNGDFEVKQNSKTDRGKYFSFHFWFPYYPIVESPNYQYAFLDYLFQGLETIFSRYQVPKELVGQVKEDIKQELASEPEKYQYVKPAHVDMLDKILEEMGI
jgi:hypothetical protein